jgi:hypothetical protein
MLPAIVEPGGGAEAPHEPLRTRHCDLCSLFDDRRSTARQHLRSNPSSGLAIVMSAAAGCLDTRSTAR